VRDALYFLNLVVYIHRNPLEANLVERLEEWQFSSYQAILNSEPSFLKKNELLGKFLGADNFKSMHTEILDFQSLKI